MSNVVSGAEVCLENMVDVNPTDQGTYLEVANIGKAVMGPIYGKPDTATILNLNVDPVLRGNGVGFAIFATAIREARLRGFQYLQVQAGNERTAGYFSIFDQATLDFALRNPITNNYEEADLTLSGAVNHLASVRRRLFPDNPTREIPKHEAILIRAPLAI